MTLPAGEVSAALSATCELGEFFEVSAPPRVGEWLPLEALTDPVVLQARVRLTREALAASAGLAPARLDARVAASTVSLGLFARVLAPPLGCLAATGVIPDWSLGSLWWQPVTGATMRLCADPSTGARPAWGAAAEHFAAGVITPLVLPLLAAFRRAGVSPVVLRGNVASALGGAARMIATVRPDLDASATGLLGELLAQPVLAGTARMVDGELRRRSCCLFYRVPNGGYCADCVLRHHGAVSRRTSPAATG